MNLIYLLYTCRINLSTLFLADISGIVLACFQTQYKIGKKTVFFSFKYASKINFFKSIDLICSVKKTITDLGLDFFFELIERLSQNKPSVKFQIIAVFVTL